MELYLLKKFFTYFVFILMYFAKLRRGHRDVNIVKYKLQRYQHTFREQFIETYYALIRTSFVSMVALSRWWSISAVLHFPTPTAT